MSALHAGALPIGAGSKSFGGVLHPHESSKVFRELCRAVGLPDSVHFHTLRHTAASLHFAEGAPPKVFQEVLGYSSIKQTLNTYYHLPTMQRDAAAKLDAVLF